MSQRRRTLCLDIERLPGLARVWDQRTDFIPVSQWTQMPRLLCVAARWLDSRETLFRAAWDDPDTMLTDVWGWLDEADHVLTFNGDKFDIPHLQGAFLIAGMPPPSTYKSIDLYKIARSKFGFESKSLAHLCYRLGLPGKNGHYDVFEAERALDGDERAQRRLRTYNRADVAITIAAYRRVAPWISTHPHVHPDSETPRCNVCGSDQLERAGTYTAVVMEYAQYRCQGYPGKPCGALVRAGHVRRVATTRGVR